MTQVKLLLILVSKFRTFANVTVNRLLFTCEINDTHYLHTA